MKCLFTLMLVGASFAANAAADGLEYDLEVNGMVCAFCAYSVSKQLESLDGVVPGSVDVDLEQGRVKVESAKELDKAQIADLLLHAGFELGKVTKSALSIPQHRRPVDEAVFLQVTMNADQLNAGNFDLILEALGAIAVQRSGQISIVGPAELELAILKPVLMGRRTVIKVDYDRVKRPDQTVAVSVSGNPEKTR